MRKAKKRENFLFFVDLCISIAKNLKFFFKKEELRKKTGNMWINAENGGFFEKNSIFSLNFLGFWG